MSKNRSQVNFVMNFNRIIRSIAVRLETKKKKPSKFVLFAWDGFAEKENRRFRRLPEPQCFLLSPKTRLTGKTLAPRRIFEFQSFFFFFSEG